MSVSLHPLARIAGVLAVLNNVFLLSAPWIASPTKPRDGQPAISGLNPIIAAMSYAVWQSVCLVFFIWTGIPMWICLFATSAPHLHMADYITIYWSSKVAQRAWKESAEAKSTDNHDDTSYKSLLDHIKSLGQSEDSTWIHPIQTAAMSDATLILFAAELMSYPEAYSYSSARFYYLGAYFAMAVYLGSRLADYGIVNATHRRRVYAFYSYTWKERLGLFGLLVWLFVIRAGSAWFLGQMFKYPLVSLVLWPKDVEIVFDRSRAEWMGSFFRTMPWLLPAMFLIGIPMQFLGVYLLRRAARED